MCLCICFWDLWIWGLYIGGIVMCIVICLVFVWGFVLKCIVIKVFWISLCEVDDLDVCECSLCCIGEDDFYKFVLYNLFCFCFSIIFYIMSNIMKNNICLIELFIYLWMGFVGWCWCFLEGVFIFDFLWYCYCWEFFLVYYM